MTPLSDLKAQYRLWRFGELLTITALCFFGTLALFCISVRAWWPFVPSLATTLLLFFLLAYASKQRVAVERDIWKVTH